MLEKETKITIKDKIQIGTIGTVSEGDNKKSLEGFMKMHTNMMSSLEKLKLNK